MLMEELEYFKHYGTPRHSGRYPWGSGDNPYQSESHFLGHIQELREQGLKDTEIARSMGITTTEFRAYKTIAKNEKRQADIAMAQRLKDKGWSNVAIGKRMNINESSVRGLLAPGAKDKAAVLTSTTDMLKRQVDEKGYVDVGVSVERHIGVSRGKLDSALAALEAEGYSLHNIKVPQLGTGEFTTMKVLAPPDTPWASVQNGLDKIHQISDFTEDGGRSYLGLHEPLSVKSDRVQVVYGNEGGDQADGLMYVRPGVDDISLGNSRYAQVRVAVDGTHYLKGMALYKDDLPDGVDIQFNTNKKDTGNKLDALKPMKEDADNPFGATVRQQVAKDKNGKERVTSAMNIVNEEGDWGNWSRTLSSQMLSKQNTKLAKEQLNLRRETKKAELDEIKSLTNPAVKQKLLEDFASSADASAVHLEAAAMPRQTTQVLLPMKSMKDTEIYAPNFRNGERVALIRYPHGGTFEIPELTVNNKNREAKRLMGTAPDAVGINHRVAERLSGADFDGDTVLVIPNNANKVKSTSALKGLKNFDPKASYPGYEGMPKMSDKQKGAEMGKVSNLITDMTIKGADTDEIARAVRHSMVVIDAQKHELNYKQSYVDNNIGALKEKYQGRKDAGAATIVSRSTAEIRVPERRARRASEGGPVDPGTGELKYTPTGRTYTSPSGKEVPSTTKTTRGAEARDARTLSSGTPMENLYASHANAMKVLANDARKTSLQTKHIPYSPSARKVYANEVASLDAKLNVAKKNEPRERQAQVVGNLVYRAKLKDNPDMTPDEKRKIKGQALNEARARTGASKTLIRMTDDEWQAVQAGAVSTNKLQQILRNSDMDEVRERATPRTKRGLSPSKEATAKAMLRAGYTQAEVADSLGVSVSTINNIE